MKTSTKTTRIINAIDNELKALLMKDLQNVRSKVFPCKTPLAA